MHKERCSEEALNQPPKSDQKSPESGSKTAKNRPKIAKNRPKIAPKNSINFVQGQEHEKSRRGIAETPWDRLPLAENVAMTGIHVLTNTEISGILYKHTGGMNTSKKHLTATSFQKT